MSTANNQQSGEKDFAMASNGTTSLMDTNQVSRGSKPTPSSETPRLKRNHSAVDTSPPGAQRNEDENHQPYVDGELTSLSHGDSTQRDCPEGINPLLWNMLQSIKRDTEHTKNEMHDAINRIAILEDQSDNTGAAIQYLKCNMASLAMSNRVLTGRLIRAESIIERQRADILDLRARSMRDNIIIKTKGNTYKEQPKENTTAKFQSFLATEMRIANADRIEIPRAHRMGQATNGFNKMMIAKVPSDPDQKRIFANAKVLANTDFSITKQVPHEIEERRIFAWPTYKRARQDKLFARFEGSRLLVDNEVIAHLDPPSLPATSEVLTGVAAAPLPKGVSEERTLSQHVFRAWAIPTTDLQGVREGMDAALADGLSVAKFAPFAFRFKDDDGRVTENFDSDGDNGTGIAILRCLRDQQAINVAVYVSHEDDAGVALPIKLKTTEIQKVVSEALKSLGRLM